MMYTTRARSILSVATGLSIASFAAADPGYSTADPVLLAAHDDNSAVELMKFSCLPAGEISIDNGSIFDLEDPAENGVFYRLANRLHKKTRPDIIRAQLLFETGENISLQQIEESERILRANRYLQDASIEPVLGEDGRVDVTVSTKDTWTLIPKVSISRSGGTNKSSLGIKEMNLLGTGMSVELQYKSDVDRDSTSLKFNDQNIGSSRYAIKTLLASSSDGSTEYLQLGKPFYSLDARDANGITLSNIDQVESFYEAGEEIADYRHEARQFDAFVGWSKGLRDGWSKRLTAGVAYDEHRFSDATSTDYPTLARPEDRKLLYPYIGFDWVQDKFEKATNFELINQTEDRFLGTRVTGRVGYAPTAFGSDRDAWILSTSAQTGLGGSARSSLILGTGLNSRIEDGAIQNMTVDISAKYFHRQSERRLLYLGLEGTLGENLDADQQLLLGGDSGLRGYPLRYQAGNKRLLLSAEQRFFTDWYPLHLLHVGGAVFFDVGRAWGEGALADYDNEWLKDVGIGLRLGNSRSGIGRMTHIDLAFPLDGGNDISNVQFLISTKKSF